MKILVIHATVGAGHKKAAEALYHGLKEATSHRVLLADILDYTNPIYKRTYQNTYTFLVTKWPWVWALFFWLTDFVLFRPLVKLLRRMINHFNARPFEHFLEEEQFDFIFAGPPYALGTIDDLPRKIFEKQLLKPKGWFVLEHTPRNDYKKFDHYRTERNYGTTIFSIFIM